MVKVRRHLRQIVDRFHKWVDTPTNALGLYYPDLGWLYNPVDTTAPLESAIEDFNLEAAFAARYLDGEVDLTDFPYYQSYVNTIEQESKLIGKPHRILFIGSGPVPLSAILFARKFPEAQIDIMDINKPALSTGDAVARKAGVFIRSKIFTDAAKFVGYGSYDAIVLSLEAGPTENTKLGILNQLFSRVGPETTVLLRGSRDMGGQEFVNTRKLLASGVKITGSAITFDGKGETLAVKKAYAGEPTARESEYYPSLSHYPGFSRRRKGMS